MSSQVKLLTQEVVLERRLGVAQLIGLLALFVFVGLTRGSPSTPFVSIANTATALRRRSLKRHNTDDGRGTTKRQVTQVAAHGHEREHDREDSAQSSSSSSNFRLNASNGSGIPSPFLRAASPTLRSAPLQKRASLGKRPRRHYYTVASSSAASALTGPSSRSVKGLPHSRGPPLRHGSAPPEDVIASYTHAGRHATHNGRDEGTVPVTLPRARSKRALASNSLSRSSTAASSLYVTPSHRPMGSRVSPSGSNAHWSDEETLDDLDVPSPFVQSFPLQDIDTNEHSETRRPLASSRPSSAPVSPVQSPVVKSGRSDEDVFRPPETTPSPPPDEAQASAK